MITPPPGPHKVKKQVVVRKLVIFECLKSLTSLYDSREQEPCANHLFYLSEHVAQGLEQNRCLINMSGSISQR